MSKGALVMMTSWTAVSLGGCAVGMSASSDPDTGSRTAEVGARAGGEAPRGGEAGLDRSAVPQVGRPPSMEPPEIHDYTLDSGLRVVLVERHALTVVSVQLQLRGGASAHPVEKAGLAAFTADMIDEGTRTRGALEVAEAVEQLGATLVSTAGYDASSLRLSALRPRLPEALEIMADVVMNPSFPDAELERVRNERMARVLQRADQPAALADDAFAAVLYGDGHPYGAPLLGTRATLSALTIDDVRAFHAARYAPGQATLVVVGDLGREDLDSMVARTFAGWTGRGEDPPALPAARTAAAERTIYIVDRPGAAQSEVRVGRVAVDWSTARYHALQVTNTVLGGSFTSRLNSKLREEKGYTYGAFSSFDLRRAPGPFEAAAAVATPVTDSSVVDFVQEIDRLSVEAVSETELRRARNYLALRLPQRFESVDDVVARLAELVLYDVPLDFYGEYVEEVLAVAPSDVREIARAELDTRRMVIVIAGDRSEIEGPLRALGVGPVQVFREEPNS